MVSATQRSKQSSFWQRLCHTALGPMVGLIVGVCAARSGFEEKTHFHYFRDQAEQAAKRDGSESTRLASPVSSDEVERRDPRLASEPAIRVVTWFSLPIATEYAGLDARAPYVGAPWYHLRSHWWWRLQLLFGVYGGLIGWLIAQQRSLGQLQRELARINRTQLPAAKAAPDLEAPIE
jgi:hypothetical protein